MLQAATSLLPRAPLMAAPRTFQKGGAPNLQHPKHSCNLWLTLPGGGDRVAHQTPCLPGPQEITSFRLTAKMRLSVSDPWDWATRESKQEGMQAIYAGMAVIRTPWY